MSSQPLKQFELGTNSLPFTDYISRAFVLTSVFSFFDKKNYSGLFFVLDRVPAQGGS